MEGAGNACGKQVKILIVPCSCVWAVREIREPLLSRPLWPGYKSDQLQRQDPGNIQSTLSFPDSRPLLSLPSSKLSNHPPQLAATRPCKSAQGAQREERGEAFPSAAPCSQSSPRTVQGSVHGSVCREGERLSCKKGLECQVGFAFWSNSAPRVG